MRNALRSCWQTTPWRWVALCWLAIGGHAFAAPATQPPPSTSPATAPTSLSAQAAELIQQLDDPDPAIRKRARIRLYCLPGEASPIVEAVLKQDDVSPEAMPRLQHAMKLLAPRAINEGRSIHHVRWETELFRKAWEEGGHARPGQRDAVYVGIDAFLKIALFGPDARNAPMAASAKLLGAAIDQGCDDPMIKVMYYVASGQHDIDNPDSDRRMFEKCVRANYPPTVKTYLELERFKSGPGWLEGEAEFDRAYKMVCDVIVDPDVEQVEVEIIASKFYEMMDRQDQRRAVLLDFMTRYMAARPRWQSPFLLFAEDQLKQADADLFGQSWDTIPPQRLKSYHDHVDGFVEWCAKGYQNDPTAPQAPFRLLLGIGRTQIVDNSRDPGVNRDLMEFWFGKTMAANPDAVLACTSKLNFLLRLGEGGQEEALQFARECAATENYYANIPFILIEAHIRLADASGDSAAYYAQPDVWKDIFTVYEGALSNFPNNPRLRCNYAKYAAKCGHWDEVNRQCQVIGDHPVVEVFGNIETYSYLRKKAARLSAAATRPAEN